jgi:hypothetical protein
MLRAVLFCILHRMNIILRLVLIVASLSLQIIVVLRRENSQILENFEL